MTFTVLRVTVQKKKCLNGRILRREMPFFESTIECYVIFANLFFSFFKKKKKTQIRKFLLPFFPSFQTLSSTVEWCIDICVSLVHKIYNEHWLFNLQEFKRPLSWRNTVTRNWKAGLHKINVRWCTCHAYVLEINIKNSLTNFAHVVFSAAFCATILSLEKFPRRYYT